MKCTERQERWPINRTKFTLTPETMTNLSNGHTNARIGEQLTLRYTPIKARNNDQFQAINLFDLAEKLKLVFYRKFCKPLL